MKLQNVCDVLHEIVLQVVNSSHVIRICHKKVLSHQIFSFKLFSSYAVQFFCIIPLVLPLNFDLALIINFFPIQVILPGGCRRVRIQTLDEKYYLKNAIILLFIPVMKLLMIACMTMLYKCVKFLQNT